MTAHAPVIRFDNVSKSFPRHRGHMLLKDQLARLISGGHRERFLALKGISFSVAEGESLAIIGHNGAGKSTILALVAGLAYPDAGSIHVNGRVAALLELGSGFHNDLTGRENVRLNAALLGLSRAKTRACFDSIVEFSGIGEFLDEPLRTYSSGMVMRLAFSVAVNVDPDILLIDEVLAVGDIAFQTKCFEKLREFRRAGKVLICVSHGNHMIRELCDRAIWLDHGELVENGSIGGVLDAYSGSQSTVSV